MSLTKRLWLTQQEDRTASAPGASEKPSPCCVGHGMALAQEWSPALATQGPAALRLCETVPLVWTPVLSVQVLAPPAVMMPLSK